MRFTEQPVLTTIFPPTYPICPSLVWSLSFTASLYLLCRFILLFFALSGGYVFQGVLGRGHVRMYLPLSPCLSLHGLVHDLLFALKGHCMGLNLPLVTAKFGRPTRRQHRQYLKISCRRLNQTRTRACLFQSITDVSTTTLSRITLVLKAMS